MVGKKKTLPEEGESNSLLAFGLSARPAAKGGREESAAEDVEEEQPLPEEEAARVRPPE